MNFKKKVLAVTPICCLFVYLLLGFTVGKEYGSIWWWGLFIFLLVPIMPYLFGQKKIVLSVSFVITIIYLFIFSYLSQYLKSCLVVIMMTIKTMMMKMMIHTMQNS